MTSNSTTSTPGRGVGGITPCLSPEVIAQQMQFFIPKNKFARKDSRTYEQIAAQYIKTCQIQISTGIRRATKDQIAQNRFPVDMDWLRDQNTSQYRHGGKLNWWFDWLVMTYPMFKIVQRGYNKNNKAQLTMAELIIPQYELQIGETAEETFRRVYKDCLDAFENDQVEYVPIDVNSLKNYIEQTRADTEMDPTARYRYELIAREILTIAELVAEKQPEHGTAIPHVANPSPFGRVYYRGLNLQNTPSVIREAALGSHTRYDVVSSVFAWQLLMINDAFKTPATKELVLERQRIRNQLAEDCIRVDVSKEFKIDIVKRAITAMGFGANLKGGAYFNPETNTWERNAINSIIKNPDDRLRFQEHAWVQEFAEEQRRINDYIQSLVDLDSLPRDIDLFNKKNQVRTSKLMAYLYQHYEYDLIQQIHSYIEYRRSHDNVDYGWLVAVHDGFYLRHKATGTFLHELAQSINEHVRIEVKQNSSWIDINDRDANKRIKNIMKRIADSGNYDRYTDYQWHKKPGTEFNLGSE